MKEELKKFCILNLVFYGAGTWTLGKIGQKDSQYIYYVKLGRVHATIEIMYIRIM
jgi:hypothetical protein